MFGGDPHTNVNMSERWPSHCKSRVAEACDDLDGKPSQIVTAGNCRLQTFKSHVGQLEHRRNHPESNSPNVLDISTKALNCHGGQIRPRLSAVVSAVH